MWIDPYSGSDGTYGSESTAQTGKKTVWIGSTYYSALGKIVPTRDNLALSLAQTSLSILANIARPVLGRRSTTKPARKSRPFLVK